MPLSCGGARPARLSATACSRAVRGRRKRGGRKRSQLSPSVSRVSTWRGSPSGKCSSGSRRPAGPGAPLSWRRLSSRGQAAGSHWIGAVGRSGSGSAALRGTAHTRRPGSSGSRSSSGSRVTPSSPANWASQAGPSAGARATPGGLSLSAAGHRTAGWPSRPVNRRRAQRGFTSPS